jgi:hypothetical protein
MTRRTIAILVTLTLAVLWVALAPQSQTPAEVSRIGVLLSGASTPALACQQAGAGGFGESLQGT